MAITAGSPTQPFTVPVRSLCGSRHDLLGAPGRGRTSSRTRAWAGGDFTRNN